MILGSPGKDGGIFFAFSIPQGVAIKATVGQVNLTVAQIAKVDVSISRELVEGFSLGVKCRLSSKTEWGHPVSNWESSLSDSAQHKYLCRRA